MLVELSTNSQMKLISLELQEKYKKLVFFSDKAISRNIKKVVKLYIWKRGKGPAGGSNENYVLLQMKKKNRFRTAEKKLQSNG